ncbi:MAG: hypothetical protein NC115_11060 [Bacteroidales bacterium]|nr:hypothetical protein [Bacteroidales bacterium]
MLKEMRSTDYHQDNLPEDIGSTDEKRIKVFHITAKGLNQSLLYFDEEDFHRIINLSAICSIAHNVEIIAYAHMSNHSHYIVIGDSIDDAERFMRCTKRTYSQFCQKKRGINKIQRRSGTTVKEISDFAYLRNCIAYVLRNPVEAKIVRHAEQYPWSSYNCYFNRNAGTQTSYSTVRDYRKKELQHILGTHMDISRSNLKIDSDGNIVPESFVATTLVESMFGHSRENLLRQIMKVNYYNLEYELTYGKELGANDMKLIADAQKLATGWFNKELSSLAVEEKIRFIGVLHNKHHASPGQICRILNLPPKLIKQIIPISTEMPTASHNSTESKVMGNNGHSQIHQQL